MSKLTVFALTSGRSGTLALCEMLKRNASHCCTVVHETNNNPWNPSMFGRAIYDHCVGDLDAVRARLRKKSKAVARSRHATYVETSHAFLKSYWDLAHDHFANIKVFHLIRHPLQVAQSEANREAWMNERRSALRTYKGRDGRPYRRWALTGLEPIYGHFDLDRLTLFQRYLVQWIEIENRAMAYLDRFGMHERCLTLHSPRDLNSPQAVSTILQFLEVEPLRADPALPGVQNRTPGYETVVGESQARECREVIERLPAQALSIFQRAPYADQEWSALLRP